MCSTHRGLKDLPNELILKIAESLPWNTLYTFQKTSRRFYRLFEKEDLDQAYVSWRLDGVHQNRLLNDCDENFFEGSLIKSFYYFEKIYGISPVTFVRRGGMEMLNKISKGHLYELYYDVSRAKGTWNRMAHWIGHPNYKELLLAKLSPRYLRVYEYSAWLRIPQKSDGNAIYSQESSWVHQPLLSRKTTTEVNDDIEKFDVFDTRQQLIQALQRGQIMLYKGKIAKSSAWAPDKNEKSGMFIRYFGWRGKRLKVTEKKIVLWVKVDEEIEKSRELMHQHKDVMIMQTSWPYNYACLANPNA
ncbi:unnamed protein product, partial [Mesorhabditis belari]|uniref:F-box domain-containing protein n=1 Tax=Mesorhabditis belari TaxID=2138241 RepID=A0AAF3ECA6_9BILA